VRIRTVAATAGRVSPPMTSGCRVGRPHRMLPAARWPIPGPCEPRWRTCVLLVPFASWCRRTRCPALESSAAPCRPHRRRDGCRLSSDPGPYGPTCYVAQSKCLSVMREWGYDGGLGLGQPANGAKRLSDAEAIRLLASVSYGRVIFTIKSLPAIRPVNHLLDEGRIIIRTRLTSAISAAVRSSDGAVVAYEADSIDPQTRTGWSVVVTGRAYTLTDPDQVLRYEQLLHPWINHADTVVAIEPEIITGLRIIATQA
jgi:hypothetical protein